MNWLAFFLKLLPTFIQGAAVIGADLLGHQKKQMVKDAMTAIVQGVGLVAPQHTTAATLAANTASEAIDGIHSLLKEVGALKAPAAVAPAPTGIALVAPLDVPVLAAA